LTNEGQNTTTWPTTFGAVCIVVGGLSFFGGCLALTSMSEIEQLHTAIPFGKGELDEQLLVELASSAPPQWVETFMSIMNIVLSVVLVGSGMAILQRAPKARTILLLWAVIHIVITITNTIVTWQPRWELVSSYPDVKGMFAAHLVIYLPMYLVLPVFLLWWLNRNHVRNEISHWR
jgi:hypothetical protein